MSSKQYDTVLAKRDGQTQQQRMPEWLDPSKVPLDNRSRKELFEYIYAIAKEINFYDHTKAGVDAADGTWQDILKYTETEFEKLYAKLQELRKAKSIPPHFSLLLAFLDLYKEPQRLMNGITGRHLDFYFHEVLGLNKNSATPDKAHVVFELKKNTVPFLLEKEKTTLLAGKDNLKKELVYKLTHDIIVNSSKVEQLKSVYVNPGNKNLLHFAAVGNSADGLGAELDKENPKWNAFGYNELPIAQIGFCLASEVMLMQEGERKISVKLDVENIAAAIKDNTTIANLFQVSLTAEKGWTEVKTVSAAINTITDRNAEIKFEVSFSPDDPAIIDYDAAFHGAGYTTSKPIMKILVSNTAAFGYDHFKNAGLVSGSISVSVKGLTTLQLENDFGVLNPKKPFLPFGPTPEADANFWIGSEEVFAKDLTQLHLNIEWKNIPAADLGNYYKDYFSNANALSNSSFTTNVSFADAAGWVVQNDTNLLFDPTDAIKKDANNVSKKMSFYNFILGGLPNKILHPVNFPFFVQRSSGTTLMQEVKAKTLHYSISAFQPVSMQMAAAIKKFKIKRPHRANAILKNGFLHMALNRGFLFRRFREKFITQVLQFSKGSATTIDPLNEPFAPEMQTLSLDYTATTGNVSFRSSSLHNYSNTEIELYHVGPFGQMREHLYAHAQNSFLFSTTVKLLPQFRDEGNFYIGLSGLNATDSLCLLFQVAEGSADPESAKADLQWSILCDNYWKRLGNLDFIFDTTNDFLTSGVVKLVIPATATTSNTIMPDGLIWLKVSIQKEAAAVCQLLDVKANAAIVEFENNDNDPLHLLQPLASNTIYKLQQPATAIKTVTQPYQSFSGRMQEDDKGYYTRVSERLRHKERTITCWDYERLILQHFPSVYKVKCINHASSATSFADAGHTLLVMVPDLTNQNAINPFQPRVDKNTLDTILQLVNDHSTTWAEHHVINPFYEVIKISVSVKLKMGYEFNYYQQEINKVLQLFLSPWINGGKTDIKFGGKVTESHIVKILEDLEYVDYITGLQLFLSLDGGTSFAAQKQFIETSGPASILVSHTKHEVKQS